jgi:predicted AAA+ superfamily ATPase
LSSQLGQTRGLQETGQGSPGIGQDRQCLHGSPTHRAHDDEIDIVLEAQSGDLAAIEVEARASLRASDWRVIRRLRDNRPDRFKAGVILYTGSRTIPLGERIWAVPVSGLWS